MHEIQNSVIPLIEQFGSYAVIIAFFAAFGETLIGIGWLMPGSTILLIMGVLAGQGYLDFTTVLIAGILGAWLGDGVNYHLGKRYGTALLRKPQLHLPESAITKAHDFLDSHGAKAVFLSRFVPGLKETVPFLAGSAEMHQGKFIFWNFLGAVGWGFEFIGIGYLFSSSLALAQAWLSRSAIVIGALVGTIIILWMLKRFLQANLPMALAMLKGARDGLLQSRPMRSFIVRHPNTVAFLSRRIDTDRFTGLPLTILAVAFLYVLILFGGIVEDFLTRDPIVYVDQIVANLMAQWRTPELTEFFTWVTYLGRAPVVAAVFLLSAAVLLLYRRYRELAALTVSLLGSALFLTLGKLAFHRPRPEIALYVEKTYSFPSGHATIAVALYGFLGYLLIRHADTLRMKLNLFFAVTLLILLIGFSRIYLGEHYLSDVYAGFLLGTLWAIIGMTLLKWMEYRAILPEGGPTKAARPLSFLLPVLALVGFYLYGTHFPYCLAVHPPVQPVTVENLSRYFGKDNHRFTYNLLGFPSRPVTLLIGAAADPWSRLETMGWKPLSPENLSIPPIFWQAREPLCRLSKKEDNRTYLLDIWKSELTYRGIPLYPAAADAIVGRKWKFLPLYLSNVAAARRFSERSLLRVYPDAQVQWLTLAPESIRKHLTGQAYFDDGKAVWIKAEHGKKETQP